MPDPTSPATATTNAKFLGNAKQFVWDIPGGQQVTTIGRNVSISRHGTAETAPLTTDDGETDGLVIYDPNEEVTIEAILPTSDGTPSIGSVLTIGVDTAAQNFVVMDWVKNWTRKDWAKITITAHAWAAMDLSNDIQSTTPSTT